MADRQVCDFDVVMRRIISYSEETVTLFSRCGSVMSTLLVGFLVYVVVSSKMKLDGVMSLLRSVVKMQHGC